jgi:hypothetical protein
MFYSPPTCCPLVNLNNNKNKPHKLTSISISWIKPITSAQILYLFILGTLLIYRIYPWLSLYWFDDHIYLLTSGVMQNLKVHIQLVF